MESPAAAMAPAPEVTAPAVAIEALAFAYPDGTPALGGVSLTIRPGETVALVGANGAGKSTLLAQLTGLLEPSSGRVRIGGIPVGAATLGSIRRRVGVVLQDSDDQLFMPTAGEDVAFGPRNLGLEEAEVERRVHGALARVGATALRERAPQRLSGGEKRAVALATVLAMEPELLLLDEPSAGLDPRARRRLIGLLRGLTPTLVVASHDLDLVLDLCARTVVLAEGRVLADGPTASLLTDPDLLEHSGLEPPLALQACPRCGGAPGGGAGTSS